MDLERMVVVPSKSRFELLVEKHGSEQAAEKHFGSPHVWKTIKESHRAQKYNLGIIKRDVKCDIVDRSALTEEPLLIAEKDIFVFLGGDNHFTYCAQKVLRYQKQNPLDRKQVMGVVLDPNKSLGALLYFDVSNFIDALPIIGRDEHSVEHWTTLEAKVNVDGTTILPNPAVGDYFVGERDRRMMSRNRVYLNGEEIFPDKSSGILVTCGNGTGQGSWYDNVHQVMFGESDYLEKDVPEARVILTEHRSKSKAVLKKGDVLIVHSYNDDDGIISPDSHRYVPFGLGARAEIKISDTTLDVVNLYG